MASFLEKILRTGDKRVLRQLEAYTKAVNSLEDSFASMTDEELRAETDKFRERVKDGESLDILLPEAFAAVRGGRRPRTWACVPTTSRSWAAPPSTCGNIAEMKTGEGKTLVATMPAYLRALSGKGVHVVTVNDYLAEYQSDLMGRVSPFPGTDHAACILSSVGRPTSAASSMPRTSPTARTTSSASTTCATTWPATVEELVQRGHNFAIVDEVDSILIDEARTPLIISGPAAGEANQLVCRVRAHRRNDAQAR